MQTEHQKTSVSSRARRSAVAMRSRVSRSLQRANGRWCALDARMCTLLRSPEEGAATAEYAVVLVAATGFAGLLVALLKSDVARQLLTDIVKQALNV